MMVLPLAALVMFRPQDVDYGATWDRIESSIRGRYYARQARAADMNRLLDKYEPIAKAAKTRNDFESAVNRMIEEFKDSHFDFLTTADQGYYLMDGLANRTSSAEMPNIGAWFRKGGDGYTVSMVLEGGAAAKAGLRKGDLVRTIDGKPFTPVESLADSVDKDVELTVERPGPSKPVATNLKVHVTRAKPLDMFLEATRESGRVIERNGRKIGYIHLWTCASDDFRNVLSSAVYGKFRDTDAFVLDIRDGFGGRPEGFGDPFFRPEVHLNWNTSPTAGMKQLFGYQRPLVVLINGGSRSAKEVLSYVFKKSGRATLIGSRTAGNVLGTFPSRVNEWSYLEIPMVEVIADGIRLEGNGVTPNVPVAQELDATGKDLYLEEALKRLERVPIAQGWPSAGSTARQTP